MAYYELPESVLLIPFHSMNGANPGHLIWDDFLPVFTLQHMFQGLDRNLMLVRYVLEGDGLWASCDMNEKKAAGCLHMMSKFYAYLVGEDYPYKLTSTKDFDFMEQTPGTADLVCAKAGAAGFGSLTDHGPGKLHGWTEADYLTTHNHGRGGLLYEFRNHVMSKMGLSVAPLPAGGPHRIVFSTESSDVYTRSLTFDIEQKVAREAAPNALIEAYQFKTLSAKEQLEKVHDAALFVSTCGGGSVTGHFLPAGASVILYYREEGGMQNNHLTGKPARLDWDLYNALSHLRVHWFPMKTRQSSEDQQALKLLIQHELRLIESEALW